MGLLVNHVHIFIYMWLYLLHSLCSKTWKMHMRGVLHPKQRKWWDLEDVFMRTCLCVYCLNLSWFHNAVSMMVKNSIPDLLQNRCWSFWHTSQFAVDTEGSPLLCFLFVYACLTFLMVEHGQSLLSVQQKFQMRGLQTNVWARTVARYKLGHGFYYSFAQLGWESSPLY